MAQTDEKGLLKLEGVEKFVEGDLDWYELSDEVRDALFTFFQEEMPYGIQRAVPETPMFGLPIAYNG